MKETTLNFSNIKLGGAKQVALSFLMEINIEQINNFNILVSKEIFEELELMNFKFLNSLIIFNSSIFKLFSLSLLPQIKNAKLIFTLFGPLYAFTPAKTITGFAQSWILIPNNLASRRLPFFIGLLFKFKFYIQFLFFKKDDVLIVETDGGKKILTEKLKFKSVYVVGNTLNSYFVNIIPKIKSLEGNIKIGVIGRNYSHKNLSILPYVLDELYNKYNFKGTIYVTLTQEEFSSMSPFFREKIQNYGSLRVSECPTFYNEMDIIFFPSLLELFSATPLESLYMKKPFICTDLPFIKDFFQDFVYLIKPNDVPDSARVINQVILLLKNKDQSLLNKLNLGSQFVSDNFQPSNRANAYLDIIRRYE